ncbi:hypothetical protein ACWCP6_33475 [Streptomyces sp. NPDC002004]
MSGRSTDRGNTVPALLLYYTVSGVLVGLVCGAIFHDFRGGLFTGASYAVFSFVIMVRLLRVVQRSVQVDDREAFRSRLEADMLKHHYAPLKTDGDHLEFMGPESMLWAIRPLKWAGGESLSRVSVHFDHDAATFVGPLMKVREIVARVA